MPAQEKSVRNQKGKGATAQHPASAGELVLQWLTYAFWGWLILGLIWLLYVVLANTILDQSVTSVVPYAIAASVVLLPLAFVTDRFYLKREPLKKVGGTAIIMVIHAVLFAVLGIIALIVTVFTAINFTITVTGASDADAKLVSLLVTSFATLLYTAAFLRTLNPFKSKKPLHIYSIAMLSLTVVLLIAAIAGPLAKGFATRNDRLIEQHLSSVETSISTYAQDNGELPDTLDDVIPNSPEAEQLITEGLVEYKKEGSVTTQQDALNGSTIEHRYQLCVEYKEAAKYDGNYSTSYRVGKKEYTSYVSTSYHGAGKECYKLKAVVPMYEHMDLDLNGDV